MATQEPDKPQPDRRPEPAGGGVRDALMARYREQEQGAGAPGAAAARAASEAEPRQGGWTQLAVSLGGPNNLHRAVFCRQFAMLIESGIPVLKALQMLAERTTHPKLRRAVLDVARGVEEGKAIHQAMALHTRVFSPLVVNIVRIGETGGILESSLRRLAEIMEGKARIRRRIRSAAMYPAVALLVAVGMLSVILVKAIPTFAAVYSESGADLPRSTQLLIAMSNVMIHYWHVLGVLAVLLIWGLIVWGRTPSGRRVYSWLALRVPGLRAINQKIAVARSTRTLGGLVAAGIPLIESLAITADTSENTLVADALRSVHDQVERGERMTGPLRKARVFPPLVVDMISIGEETGTLDRMLNNVADIFDAEVDATLSGLSSIIEPVLIVLLGGVVIFIALAVLLPYFQLAKVVGD